MRDIVGRISDGRVVLPVIQRRLVWATDKMEELFDSLFQQNSFGSIICTEEGKGSNLLFPYREFTLDGDNTHSVDVKVVPDTLLFVIDGQQRLQSFYIGLCGTFEGKKLYYDLFSDHSLLEHNFKFADSINSLPKNNAERSERIANGMECLKETLWFPVPKLFALLKRTKNSKNVANKIFEFFSQKGKIKDDKLKDLKKDHIRENVSDFEARIFDDKSIGISKVEAHMCDKVDDDHQRIVEMFQRLNSNGTHLSTYDLVASTLKGFDYRMESFLDDVTEKYSGMGINQDIMMKMLLILNNKPNKGMADMTQADASFIISNRDRIKTTLEALHKFLQASNHEEWFTSSNRSVIPLYFLAYHIFYHSEKPEDIRKLFDAKDQNFRNMSLWLKVSLLNNVFKKGCGWDPSTTGIRLTHQVLNCYHKGDFPAAGLFQLYANRLHFCFDGKNITPECLDLLDQEYVFYAIYGMRSSSLRSVDKDHIHPRALLTKAKVGQLKIDSIGNLQLIDLKANRGKNNRELRDWINTCVADKQAYIRKHLIPEDESLWTSDRFNGFLRARLRLIADKIKSEL